MVKRITEALLLTPWSSTRFKILALLSLWLWHFFEFCFQNFCYYSVTSLQCLHCKATPQLADISLCAGEFTNIILLRKKVFSRFSLSLRHKLMWDMIVSNKEIVIYQTEARGNHIMQTHKLAAIKQNKKRGGKPTWFLPHFSLAWAIQTKTKALFSNIWKAVSWSIFEQFQLGLTEDTGNFMHCTSLSATAFG